MSTSPVATPGAQPLAQPVGQPVVVEQASVQPMSATPVTVYSHSPLFYWWPVWAIGYLLAGLTYFQGEYIALGDATVLVHPSKNLGVIYTVVFLMVILMTHATVRGLASLTVIVSLLAATFLFAYLGWWDRIFGLVQSLAIFMNMGFYVFFSTAVFLVWASSYLIFDRTEHWTFHAGQMVHHTFLSSGEQTYDSRGMSIEKMRDDLFRHWVLGLGSGDLKVSTTGAAKTEFVIPNVLFIGGKVSRIQRLTAMKPDETPDVVQVTTA